MDKESESEVPLLRNGNSSVNHDDSEVGFLQPTSIGSTLAGRTTWSERCPSMQSLELDNETASLLPPRVLHETERYDYELT